MAKLHYYFEKAARFYGAEIKREAVKPNTIYSTQILLKDTLANEAGICKRQFGVLKTGDDGRAVMSFNCLSVGEWWDGVKEIPNSVHLFPAGLGEEALIKDHEQSLVDKSEIKSLVTKVEKLLYRISTLEYVLSEKDSHWLVRLAYKIRNFL